MFTRYHCILLHTSKEWNPPHSGTKATTWEYSFKRKTDFNILSEWREAISMTQCLWQKFGLHSKIWRDNIVCRDRAADTVHSNLNTITFWYFCRIFMENMQNGKCNFSNKRKQSPDCGLHWKVCFIWPIFLLSGWYCLHCKCNADEKGNLQSRSLWSCLASSVHINGSLVTQNTKVVYCGLQEPCTE